MSNKGRTRGVIYARVSTTRQMLASGIQRQLDTCFDFARKRDIEVVHCFVDACSGETDSRASLLGLIDFIADHESIDCVIVEEVDRWTRNTQTLLWKQLELCKVELVVASERQQELIATIEDALKVFIERQTA